jgi:copper(I)-binding protein
VVAAVLAVFAVTGCSAAGGGVSAGNAYIPVPTTPDTTVAYLEIRNNGAADELLRVQTSVGGTVTLRAPVIPGASIMTMRSVSEIPVPADSTLHLAPNSDDLLITGVSGLVNGKAITLKLTFAHAGTISVIALVTNPKSGGSSYFLN